MRAVDSAGNADPSPATYSWIVDRAGVYGHPSMATDVFVEGGNKQVIGCNCSRSCRCRCSCSCRYDITVFYTVAKILV